MTRSKIVIITGSALVLAAQNGAISDPHRTVGRDVSRVDPDVYGPNGASVHFIDLGNRKSGSATLVARAVRIELAALYPDRDPACFVLLFPDPTQVQDVARAWGFSPAKGDRLFRVDAYKPAVDVTNYVAEDGAGIDVEDFPDGEAIDRFILEEHVTRGTLRRFRFRVDTRTGLVNVVWKPSGDEAKVAREAHADLGLDGYGMHRLSRDRVAEFVPCRCTGCMMASAFLGMDPTADVLSVGVQLGLYPEPIGERGIDAKWLLQVLDDRRDTSWMASIARRMLEAGVPEQQVFRAEQLQTADDGRTH